MNNQTVIDARLTAISLYAKQGSPFPNPYEDKPFTPEWNEFFKTWEAEKKWSEDYDRKEAVKGLFDLAKKGLEPSHKDAWDIFEIIAPVLLKNEGIEDIIAALEEVKDGLEEAELERIEEEERQADPVEAFAGVPRGS